MGRDKSAYLCIGRLQPNPPTYPPNMLHVVGTAAELGLPREPCRNLGIAAEWS